MAEIYLARHGETDHNRAQRATGQIDTLLNNAGRHQASELAERAVALGIVSLWSSDLSRALQTARVVGEQTALTPRIDPRLREIHRGAWEGRLYSAIAVEEPELHTAWQTAPEAFRFPAGESTSQLQQRVLAALEDIRRVSALPALVICHAGPIRAALCARHPRGLCAWREFDLPNGALVELP